MEMKVQCAHTELVDIDLLVPNPKNPNKHPDSQIQLLAKIMKHQGWRSPVVVSKRSGFVTKGHGRLLAARFNGWTQVPVDRQEYATEADEYADMVADNKIAELAEHDDEKMKLEVLNLGLDSSGFDLDLLGIVDLDLTTIEEINSASESEEWVGMPGFEARNKEIRLTVIFNTELERIQFCENHKIDPTNKNSGQWTYRV